MSRPDLLIIGGGAAGLSAAATARALGLSVELIDERAGLGGNYYAGAGDINGSTVGLVAGYRRGAELIGSASGSRLRSGVSAWRIEPDGTTRFIDASGAVSSIAPKRLLIATGAMERPVLIGGATLPGVMYAGAAQLMLKTARSVPAGRSVLVGSGPLLLLLAKQLISFGAAPSALVETTPASGNPATLRDLLSALNAPSLIREGIGLYAALRKSGVAWHRAATEVSILGRQRAERVAFTDGRGERRIIDADLVLLHDGVVPNDHVTRQLGCDEEWNKGQSCFNPLIDQWGETSRPGIFAAGDCTGIWGAQAAELSGRIAVLAIAEQLGVIDTGERDRRAEQPLRQRARQKAFRPFLESRFPPSLSRAGMAVADTVICRCENVTAGEIRTAVAEGATEPNQVKAFTRCGMGFCQGRSCSMALAEIIDAETGRGVAAIGRQEIRAPLKPIPLGSIASAPAGPEALS
ncbi:NADPH-dependent 2,4-dienoyl-CoA reductase/sulfur reductase-like enzyme [Hoeflea marina]|uniref:NADPH-dependent 2,4-dienoyl-CoA reductase/sulfur reductase-like enzyme n=1 Tax=Hoeflea marina TaxID=274592 RepID=A0A317PN35_9HYPH|nr:NAD(P)/FAD-dependent oxidoreductase [Hoeflea marina]PWW01943.1 NADPH-dependent 2,4-dienoyl-CoA reductase/sulfur reductase-like enzyme [Hoeflea marina]